MTFTTLASYFLTLPAFTSNSIATPARAFLIWPVKSSFCSFLSPWRRKWQPTPVFLPGKSHGQRSLEACDSHASHFIISILPRNGVDWVTTQKPGGRLSSSVRWRQLHRSYPRWCWDLGPQCLLSTSNSVQHPTQNRSHPSHSWRKELGSAPAFFFLMCVLTRFSQVHSLQPYGL